MRLRTRTLGDTSAATAIIAAPTPANLKRHVISVHTKDYPHKCAVCGKGFHRPSELKKHSASHKAKKTAPVPATAISRSQTRSFSAAISCPFTLRNKQQPEQSPTPSIEASPPASPTHRKPAPKRTIGAAQLAAPAVKKASGVKGPRERRVYHVSVLRLQHRGCIWVQRHVISIHTKDYPHRCQYCSKASGDLRRKTSTLWGTIKTWCRQNELLLFLLSLP